MPSLWWGYFYLQSEVGAFAKDEQTEGSLMKLWLAGHGDVKDEDGWKDEGSGLGALETIRMLLEIALEIVILKEMRLIRIIKWGVSNNQRWRLKKSVGRLREASRDVEDIDREFKTGEKWREKTWRRHYPGPQRQHWDQPAHSQGRAWRNVMVTD